MSSPPLGGRPAGGPRRGVAADPLPGLAPARSPTLDSEEVGRSGPSPLFGGLRGRLSPPRPGAASAPAPARAPKDLLPPFRPVGHRPTRATRPGALPPVARPAAAPQGPHTDVEAANRRVAGEGGLGNAASKPAQLGAEEKEEVRRELSGAVKDPTLP